jgi:hypothetical protein
MARAPNLKLTIELELTDGEARFVSISSIERVLNNALNIGALAEAHLPQEVDRIDASNLWQDAEELKPVTVKIWHAVHDAIFKARSQ